MDWDDLRYFLAIARHGGVTAAAEGLGVNHSTVYRRIDHLEAVLGARLLERGGRGVALTPAGEELLGAARHMDDAAASAQRRISGRDLEPAGTVRLTAPDDLVDRLLLPLLCEFRQQHPRIAIELAIDNRFLDLSRREADVALRPTARPAETLVGRKAATLGAAIYAHASLAGQAMEEMDWIAWEAGLGPTSQQQWMRGHVRDDQIKLSANSVRTLYDAAMAGIGAVILPCFLGDGNSDLVRVAEPRMEWNTDLWILTHPDLRGAARIRLLTDFLFDKIQRLRTQLQGGGE